MGRVRIEIFTAGCPLCTPVIDLVKSIAQSKHDIVTYNLVNQFESPDCVFKVEKYGIKRLPAIAVDGKLLNCCVNNDITEQDLILAGIS